MAIVFPNVAEEGNLNYMLGKTTAPTGQTYLFYTNNYAPVPGSVLSNFTLLSGGLYTPLSLSPGDWTTSVVGGVGSSATAQKTVNISGATTIYGYVVVDTATQLTILWAEQWTSTGFAFPSGGGSITFTPTVTAT